MAGLEVDPGLTREQSALLSEGMLAGERVQAQAEWPGQQAGMGWAPCSQVL